MGMEGIMGKVVSRRFLSNFWILLIHVGYVNTVSLKILRLYIAYACTSMCIKVSFVSNTTWQY